MLYYVIKFLKLYLLKKLYFQKLSNGTCFLNQFKYLRWPSFDFVFVEGKPKQEIKTENKEVAAFCELRCEEDSYKNLNFNLAFSLQRFFDVDNMHVVIFYLALKIPS